MQVNYQSSPLQSIQQEGKTLRGKRYQVVQTNLNRKQRELYNLALYGIKGVHPREQVKFTEFQKALIEVRRKRTQKMINRWKQIRLQEHFEFSFLEKLFPSSATAMALVKASQRKPHISDKDIIHFTFKELGITKPMIIEKLLEWKILPKNFYQLT